MMQTFSLEQLWRLLHSLVICKEYAVPHAEKHPALNDLYGLSTTVVRLRFTDDVLTLSDAILLNMAKRKDMSRTASILILVMCDDITVSFSTLWMADVAVTVTCILWTISLLDDTWVEKHLLQINFCSELKNKNIQTIFVFRCTWLKYKLYMYV